MALTGALLLTACDNELDITQSFPFVVETMPVPKEVKQGGTVEIRCTLKADADFAGTAYTMRYFQYDGEGLLKMGKDGVPMIPNDRYPVEKGEFRLYYTSKSSERQSLEIVFEDNHGQSQVLELDFNNKRDDGNGSVTVTPPFIDREIVEIKR